MDFRTILAKIKTNLIAILGVLLTVSVLVAKTLYGLYVKAKNKAKKAQAQSDHKSKVMEADKTIEKKFRSRRAAAKDEIKNTGGSSTFRNPNKLRDDDSSE